MAYRCYNDEIVSSEDILLYWFECEVCKEQWMSVFCFCPKCNKVNKYKILSGEQAVQIMKDKIILDNLYALAVYGLLNEEK